MVNVFVPKSSLAGVTTELLGVDLTNFFILEGIFCLTQLMRRLEYTPSGNMPETVRE